jgi:polysaccharide pyruvyl transferase WcaK-like protein
MKKISVFDTTISSYNLGNQIIMDAVYTHLNELFPNDFFFKLPSMEITSYTVDYLKNSDRIFFGGTNALSAQMENYKQWGLNLFNYNKIKDVVLMGVGWWQYQNINTSLYTKYLLSKTLSPQYFHSVRDNYTLQKLNAIGFKNVVNTGCPTMWELTDLHCKLVPKLKSENVVITLTDYNQDVINDRKLIDLAAKNYSNVYFWVQGKADLDYINSFEIPQINIINPSLSAFDELLKTKEIDYIGTRLHAGIRALQHKRRTLILAVDNRAAEMSKDFNLPVLDRKQIDLVEQNFIQVPYKTDIKIPSEDIEKWKNQFKLVK